jgi:hypothetical protein
MTPAHALQFIRLILVKKLHDAMVVKQALLWIQREAKWETLLDRTTS